MLAEPVKDIVDASVEAYQLQHSSCHQRDDDEFSHADDACSHRAEPSEQVETPVNQADDAGRKNSQKQNQRYVYTGNGRSQYDNVGHYFSPFHSLRVLDGFHLCSAYYVIDKDQYGGGQGDQEIGPELVAHGATLRSGSRNGGIGDERKIIAEEGAPYDKGGYERHADVGLVCYARSHRNKSHNGAY